MAAARPRRAPPATHRNPPGAKHRKTPHAGAEAVGKRVRAMRRDAGITFDAFVEETGLGRGYVSELERGLVVPTIDALAKVARALGVPMRDLFPEDNAPEG